jgi:hypothetical protein
MRESLRDALTVYVGGDEVPGVLLYGLESTTNDSEPRFPGEAWPGFVSLKTYILHGESWRVRLWEVALSEIPPIDVLQHAIGDTLDAFLGSGVVVAWMGLEGSFCDPPSLFLPECMSGGVITARSASGKRWNGPGAAHSFEPLSDNDLLALRAEAHPLASVE